LRDPLHLYEHIASKTSLVTELQDSSSAIEKVRGCIEWIQTMPRCNFGIENRIETGNLDQVFRIKRAIIGQDQQQSCFSN